VCTFMTPVVSGFWALQTKGAPLSVCQFLNVADEGSSREFPAQKCRLIENQSHETGSLSEKVHGCHILP